MRSFVQGIALTVVAALVTAAYLASITVDDGLESLMFVPVLGGLVAALEGWRGWRGRDPQHAMLLSCGVGVTALIAFFALAAGKRDPLLAVAAVSVAVLLLGTAFVAGLVGWSVGAVIRRLVRRTSEPRAMGAR